MNHTAESSGPKKIVLIVEDDSMVSNLLKCFLTRKGWESLVAQDPSEAMALLEAQSVTHALVDLHLNTHSGLDLIRNVRDRWPAIRIVAMTASQDGEGQGALAAGAEKVLIKPFPSLETVRASIEE